MVSSKTQLSSNKTKAMDSQARVVDPKRSRVETVDRNVEE